MVKQVYVYLLEIAWRNGGKRRSDCKQYADSHVLVVSYRQISMKLRIKKLIAMLCILWMWYLSKCDVRLRRYKL